MLHCSTCYISKQEWPQKCPQPRGGKLHNFITSFAILTLEWNRRDVLLQPSVNQQFSVLLSFMNLHFNLKNFVSLKLYVCFDFNPIFVDKSHISKFLTSEVWNKKLPSNLQNHSADVCVDFIPIYVGKSHIRNWLGSNITAIVLHLLLLWRLGTN